MRWEADMAELILTQDKFVNNKFTFSYGDREALFTIVDEEFAGSNNLGRINRITVLVRIRDKAGAQFATTVIGFGDGFIAIRSGTPGLRGKLLNKDNMGQCVITLKEADE
jgi:hypothetical protein